MFVCMYVLHIHTFVCMHVCKYLCMYVFVSLVGRDLKCVHGLHIHAQLFRSRAPSIKNAPTQHTLGHAKRDCEKDDAPKPPLPSVHCCIHLHNN